MKVEPKNWNLLSDDEKGVLIKKLAIEFSTENLGYKILIIPKIVDIAYNIEFQKNLYSKLDSKTKKDIISKRIKELKELVGSEEIIENEYYIEIWCEDEEEICLKRAREWVNRLNICNLEAKILEEEEINRLMQSFTMPEVSNESFVYRENNKKRKEI